MKIVHITYILSHGGIGMMLGQVVHGKGAFDENTANILNGIE